ncbi:unnamed protein product [Rhizoctonia solani]|uniref:DRBM domain-containing protein n=1 Tax=Rhizoctonia solani TaxID=456999 RepID=A0A8H3BPN4_9AGAM|nr:unnamed protein product [Rhizoctonia solani]
MPSPYKFVDPRIKPYSAQLQECSERHKFELESKSTTKKENGYDVHEFYFIVNGIAYTQYMAISSTLKEAKNKAAGFIISSGVLEQFTG